MYKFGSLVIVGGNDSIGIIDEESEILIAQFKCDGNVKQICVTPDEKKLIFVSDNKDKNDANVYKINLEKQCIKDQKKFRDVTAMVNFADNLFFYGSSKGKLYLANIA